MSSLITIVSLQVGRSQTMTSEGSGEWWDKEWTSGICKESVSEPQFLGYEGFAHDEQADRKVHGGVDKAVCVYSQEHYAHWEKVLGRKLPYGAFGENLTVSGALESEIHIGDRFQVGEVVLEVSQPRQPCWKPARLWRRKQLTKQIEETGKTGFYFRVIRHGSLQAGERLERTRIGQGGRSIAFCNQVMYTRPFDKPAALELSNCQPLSGSWKDQLYKRAIA